MMLLALSAPAVAVSCSKDPGKEQTDDKTTDTGNTPSGPQNPGDASIINIKAGEDLQAALDGAAVGTIVRVQGGVTFKGQSAGMPPSPKRIPMTTKPFWMVTMPAGSWIRAKTSRT